MYYGYYEYKASISGNSLTGRQEGPNIIKFFDDEQTISYVLPRITIGGMLWGARIIEWFGSIQFKDEQNDYICKLQFYEGGGFFQKRVHPSDYFEYFLELFPFCNNNLLEEISQECQTLMRFYVK
jgi:hypothetical protein